MIRTNLLGYAPSSVKVAVWESKEDNPESFKNRSIVDAVTGKGFKSFNESQSFNAYGPFQSIKKLDFSTVTKSGRYLKAGAVMSPKLNHITSTYLIPFLI